MLISVSLFAQDPSYRSITDTGSLRAKVNEWVRPNASITATRLNTLFNATISMVGGEVDQVITSVSSLRTLSAPLTKKLYFTKDLQKEGQWYYDSLDLSSTDNGGTVLVSGTKRFKRVIPDGKIQTSWFGSLNAAIAGLGATVTTLSVSTAQTLSANLTIPANITLEVLQGGTISTTGYTLTINGTFVAGRYNVFTGSGTVVFGPGSIAAQFPEWDGAKNNGTDSVATTTAFARQVKRGNPIELGVGTYLVTSISSYLNQPLIIKGQLQREQSVIQTTAEANVGISIASVHPVLQSVLKDFSLIGTSLNTGGIQLGNATAQSVIAFASIENLRIINFTGSNAYGISLNSVQELEINNCYIKNNYNGIYRPDLGYVTSTKISGKNSYCGYNLNRGLAIEGKIFDLHVKDVIFEGNGKEGIYYNYGNDASVILINDCYLEANCKSGTGLAAITMIGGTTDATKVNPLIQRNQFHGNYGDVVKPMIYLDNVIGGEVSNCTGLGVDVFTTATVGCHFRDNATRSSYFVNWKNFYSNLVGNITADDIDLDGKRFYLGKRRMLSNFADKVGYDSGTVFIAADSMKLPHKKYVDSLSAGKIAVTGTPSAGFMTKFTNGTTATNSTLVYENSGLGRIGVATTNPLATFHVVGTVRAGVFTSFDASGYGGGTIYGSYSLDNGEWNIAPAATVSPVVFSPNGGVTIGSMTYRPPLKGLTVKGRVLIGGIADNNTDSVQVTGRVYASAGFKTASNSATQLLASNGGEVATSTFATPASVSLKADAANAALTGVPTAPTAAYGTNTTQIATMAAIKQAIDSATNISITVTPTGTTGAQTINKLGGFVNFAAGATSLTVTNSLVTSNTIVRAQIQSNDDTAKTCVVVPVTGGFTIYLNAAAAAETKVSFEVTPTY